jgi:hypothetical protein
MELEHPRSSSLVKLVDETKKGEVKILKNNRAQPIIDLYKSMVKFV